MYLEASAKKHSNTPVQFTSRPSQFELMYFFLLHFSVHVTDDNLRTQPKHVAFLTQLLMLFQFCHICKADGPQVSTRQEGTMAVVTTTCRNPKCTRRIFTWRSQPNMPGTQIAAGNFLLCFAILMAGGSASKVIHIFQHMGLGCVSLRSFFRYQRVSNFI